MNDFAKVSIVIPIYNAQDTLERCLDSVLDQDYKNLEILLIDDESTDDSVSICDKYCKLYPDLFIIVKQKNGGPAKARNSGIERATGDYISFLDADDYIEPNMVSCMIEAAKKENADMVVCGYYKCFSGKDSVIQYKIPTGLYQEDKAYEIALKLVDETNVDDIPPYSWVRLVRTQILKQSGLLFCDELVRSEDYHFWVRVHFYIHNIYVLNEPLYHYVENPKSITHSYVEHYWEDVLFIYKDLLKVLPDDSEVCRRVNVMLLRRAMIAFNNATRNVSFAKAFREIKRIAYDQALNNAIHRLETKDTKRYKLFPILMKNHGRWIVVSKYLIRYMVKK